MAELLWRYPGWCNLLRLVFSNHISFSIDTRQWVVRWILLSLKRPFSYISWRIDGVFCADEMRDSCNRTRRPFHISSLSFSKTRYWPAIQWWPHTALARCHFCLKHFMYRCIKSQFRKQRKRSTRDAWTNRNALRNASANMATSGPFTSSELFPTSKRWVCAFPSLYY